MLRLAYFSPMPPQHTGIADYSADLLPVLATMAEVTVFTDNNTASSALEPAGIVIAPIDAYFGSNWQYDMTIYQIGNSLYHEVIYAAAIRRPGVVVLHDYTLHHFVASTTVGRGDFASYLREMALEQGPQGYRDSWRIREGAHTPLFEVPLTARLIDKSIGLLVHSEHTKRLVERRHPRSRVGRTSQPIPLPPMRDPSCLRTELGLPQDAFVIITCGSDTPEKRLDIVANAVETFHQMHPSAIWLKTGAAFRSDGRGTAAEHLQEWIYDIGYVNGLSSLNSLLMASDLCVNLRFPTAGETSASCLRAMAAGCPVIVSDVGWYRELPSESCPRVVHDGTEVSQLVAIFEAWHGSEMDRLTAGILARQYVAENCAPEKVAAAYIGFVETILNTEVLR